VDDDRQLVETYLTRRDDASFVALYRAHSPALYRMAWRLADMDQDTAEEVVQDVWVRATQRLATFRFEAALRTWLIAILIRCVAERRRRRRDHGEPLDDTFAVSGPSPATTIDLERAITRLPAGMREVFLLHDVEGLTHDEVAQCLGVSSGTSKSQLFEARQRLRLWLGRMEHGA
jgi:RNA polymerase sigma-70 factor (ECF subfamily)